MYPHTDLLSSLQFQFQPQITHLSLPYVYDWGDIYQKDIQTTSRSLLFINVGPISSESIFFQ